jgi:hypothetical protein
MEWYKMTNVMEKRYAKGHNQKKYWYEEYYGHDENGDDRKTWQIELIEKGYLGRWETSNWPACYNTIKKSLMKIPDLIGKWCYNEPFLLANEVWERVSHWNERPTHIWLKTITQNSCLKWAKLKSQRS